MTDDAHASNPLTPELTRLEALERSLPFPMGTLLRDAITEMIAFYLFNRDRRVNETRAQIDAADALATAFADSNLERMGPARLASREFWDLYRTARDQGQPAHWALDDAAAKTPHLEVRMRHQKKKSESA